MLGYLYEEGRGVAKSGEAAARWYREAAEGGSGGEGGEEADPLYAQAIELVAREQKASTSFIQRHLQIGYNRAARIVEQMEADGLIGPPNHVGRREIIVRQPPDAGY